LDDFKALNVQMIFNAFLFMGTCPLKIVSILILKLVFRQYQNIKIYKKDYKYTYLTYNISIIVVKEGENHCFYNLGCVKNLKPKL